MTVGIAAVRRTFIKAVLLPMRMIVLRIYSIPGAVNPQVAVHSMMAPCSRSSRALPNFSQTPLAS